MEWSASCFLRSVGGPRSRSGMSGEEEYVGSLPRIETGRPPPGKLLFRRNYLCFYSGVKNVYVLIEYTRIYGMFYGFHYSRTFCKFLFFPLRPAVTNKLRNAAAITFLGNKSTPNITPPLSLQKSKCKINCLCVT